jgi:CRP/FNR family cyclic AMP-dependent transcriptional regulator
MSDSILAALTEIGIFKTLADPDRQRLSSFLRKKSFDPNQTIFTQGETGCGLYLIRKGRVKICADDWQGNELIFTYLSSGDTLGEIAILDGLPRSATAVAITPTDTLYLDRTDFLEFLKTSPEACIDIIISLCKSMRRVSIHLEEISFLDVSGRIARNLISITSKEKPYSTCAVSQEELANMVGASRVAVNKILNSFVDLGFIQLARKKITILNEHELKRIGNYDLNQ